MYTHTDRQTDRQTDIPPVSRCPPQGPDSTAASDTPQDSQSCRAALPEGTGPHGGLQERGVATEGTAGEGSGY